MEKAIHLCIETGSHESAMSRINAFARAQQVGGQAACQLHLVLNVAVVVEVPVEAIPARDGILVPVHGFKLPSRKVRESNKLAVSQEHDIRV